MLIFETAVIVGLAIVLDPDIVSSFSEFLLGKGPYRRLVALLLLSSAALWLLFLATGVTIGTLRVRLDRTLRALERERFARPIDPLQVTTDVLVAIPAHNESESIERVIASVPQRVLDARTLALVIDDGSKDETAARAAAAGAKVASLTFNRGQGAALRLANDIAQELRAKVLVTMDADGQHRGEEIERLVEPVLRGQADFVVGSRRLGTEASNAILRRLGVTVFSALVRWATGMPVTDCASGFRALRVSAIPRMRLEEDQYQTLEFLFEAHRAGLRYAEVPISIDPRMAGESKKGPNFLYGWRFARSLVRSFFR
jgi:glycosyltransferase involved in cell wall biosynthesis